MRGVALLADRRLLTTARVDEQRDRQRASVRRSNERSPAASRPRAPGFGLLDVVMSLFFLSETLNGTVTSAAPSWDRLVVLRAVLRAASLRPRETRPRKAV